MIATHVPSAVHVPAGPRRVAAPAAPGVGAANAGPDPSAARSAAGGVQLSGAGNGQWRLNMAPPGLGPVRIDLGLQQGQAVNAQFWVQHPAAASTIQGGLAELRGALASGGLSLGQFGVALGSGGRQEPERRQRPPSHAAGPSRPQAVGAVASRRATPALGLDVLG